MYSNYLSTLLASITSELHARNNDEEQAFGELQYKIAAALLHQDISGMSNQKFLFERSDLFLSENMGRHRDKAETIIKKIQASLQEKEPERLQVFVRSLPVRTTQLQGSVTNAAAGSRVSTIGPIRDSVTGRLIWFDFVKVKKLVPLYIQGQQHPALLFDAEFTVNLHQPLPAPDPAITRNYKVVPDTVWIHARLFDINAPEGYYAGLRVKGGEIVLNAAPQLAGGKLTVSNTTTAQCNFNLEHNDAYESDPASPYGIDARNAKYKLPEHFRFSFKNTTATISDIADAAWKVYGQENEFKYSNNQNSVYNPFLGRIAIPMECINPKFVITDCQSPFNIISGKTKIEKSWWGIPVAKIDIDNPTEADGNGAIIVLTHKGLFAQWANLQYNQLSLQAPLIIGEPGRIGITEFAGNASGASQNFDLWQDNPDKPGCTIDLTFSSKMLYIFNTMDKGDELLACICNANVNTDRPVKVDGTAVSVSSKNSLLIMAVNKDKKLFTLADENMIWDNKLLADEIPKVKPMALALHNALFTVTPPNGLVIFAEISNDFTSLHEGKMFLYFGLFSYLPTLPDPYAADLGILESQFGNTVSTGTLRTASNKRESRVSAWLVGLIQWKEQNPDPDKASVSFHFAALEKPLEIEKDNTPKTAAELRLAQVNAPFLPVFKRSELNTSRLSLSTSVRAGRNKHPLFGKMHDFALIDVSSKANQMGIAFSYNPNLIKDTLSRHYHIDIPAEDENSIFPIQINGLDVVSKGRDAQAFTVPQISWEPVLNKTKPECIEGSTAKIPDPFNPSQLISPEAPFDPPVGWNYYQNDGTPTRLGNLSKNPVPLSPIPLSKYLVRTYNKKEDGKTYALFNLPFGMVAFSFLNSNKPDGEGQKIDDIMPVFDNYIIGGLQLELTGGKSANPGDSPVFEGYTFQMININDAAGKDGSFTNLANGPHTIFTGEFSTDTNPPPGRPAVPLQRINISGYGASTFSNWENEHAVFAQTSQAFFNVATGRTSREVVQVKSIGYPFGIRFVRTITLIRMNNGYVARVDSGWQAQSDGLFDFRYFVFDKFTKETIPNPVANPYNIHPGLIKGLYNIRNVKEADKKFNGRTDVQYDWQKNTNSNDPVPVGPSVQKEVILRAITFDCDVQIDADDSDNIIEGGTKGRVASKGVTAYIQLAPAGAPIDAGTFKELMETESNTIGGPINCTLKIAGTNQRMRLDRFDMNTSQDKNGAFVVAGAVRGAVVLPKDGSWTMVQHARGTGAVTPMPDKLSVSLICEGLLDKNKNTFPDVKDKLHRIAYPGDLLKNPDDSTINFGFLQNMNAQKVLFLTPAFKMGIKSLISKTPPLLADAYRLMKSNSIFPKIGNATDNFGAVIPLLKGVDANGNPVEAFSKLAGITDMGSDVYELLELNVREDSGKLLDQGYKLIKAKGNDLLNKALKFDLPAFSFPLVNLENVLKIEIEYKAQRKTGNAQQPTEDFIGKFDFDIDSFAEAADTWKARMNNMAMVVDLGPYKRLMTIKGNFNAQKGKETDFGSKPDDNAGYKSLPKPQIEFSEAVRPVMDLLEILEQMSTSTSYGDTLKKGLKVAMSNSANIWEYKFEATKEIGMVRFPPEQNLYNSPQTPLKLEASMSIGVFFNAALKATTNPADILPAAGAFFKFHGGIQVMCVSVGAAAVYAVGNVDVELRAVTTQSSPTLIMKFGFGAQVTVGLAVVGNASVLFMVGAEIVVGGPKTAITAFMLFRGHAELLGGLVSVTITIEARGTIEKEAGKEECNCYARVTFAIDISIFLIIDISFSESWGEERQVA